MQTLTAVDAHTTMCVTSITSYNYCRQKDCSSEINRRRTAFAGVQGTSFVTLISVNLSVCNVMQLSFQTTQTDN